MIRSTFLFFCLFFCLTQTCHGLEITFRPSASVDGASVSLAEVADFDSQSELAESLKTQAISPAPPPGQDFLLQTGDIIQNLTRTLGVPPSVIWNGPATIRVYRKGVSIGPEKIQSIIADFLQKHRNDLPEAEIRFIASSLPLPFMIPTGELTWVVIPSHPGILRSSSMSLILSVDGHVRKNIAIAGHIEAMAPVVVAATSVQRGCILTADQVRILTRNIAENNAPCLNPREIIGQKTNRNIKEGDIIEQAWVDIPPMVARGQMVKIILNEGELHLSTTGLANMNGTKGQIIRVQNIASKKMIYCRVSAPGIVEVQL